MHKDIPSEPEKITPFQQCAASSSMLRDKDPAARVMVNDLVDFSAKILSTTGKDKTTRKQWIARLIMDHPQLKDTLAPLVNNIPQDPALREEYFHNTILPVLENYTPDYRSRSLPITRG